MYIYIHIYINSLFLMTAFQSNPKTVFFLGVCIFVHLCVSLCLSLYTLLY